MEATMYAKSDCHVIELRGDLNATSSLKLEEVLQKAISSSPDQYRLVVNCERLEHISSAGIGVFISYLKELESRQIKLVFCGLNASIRDMIEASRLEIPAKASVELGLNA